MVAIFENAGIIGLGLIGGSLARAMKKHGITKNITGYTGREASSARALELGMIDFVATSITEIAEKCDVIIICTPLSIYEYIFKELAHTLVEKQTIISDVGSLKMPVIDLAKKYLAKENFNLFIPAHPIAGTEKTGVESGFAELFEGKNIILATNINNPKQAIDKISELWKLCGSKIQIIDAASHDKIYAEVSHLPQLLAYCYAMVLLENKDVIDKDNLKNNYAFWHFSRICASDPAIWIDIFSMNKENLEASLDKFIVEISSTAISTQSGEMSATGSDSNALLSALPTLISSTLIKYSHNAGKYAGSGFKDFTSYNSNQLHHTDKSIEFTNQIIAKSKKLMGLIKEADNKNAMDFMYMAVGFYKNLKV